MSSKTWFSCIIQRRKVRDVFLDLHSIYDLSFVCIEWKKPDKDQWQIMAGYYCRTEVIVWLVSSLPFWVYKILSVTLSFFFSVMFLLLLPFFSVFSTSFSFCFDDVFLIGERCSFHVEGDENSGICSFCPLSSSRLTSWLTSVVLWSRCWSWISTGVKLHNPTLPTSWM